MPIHARTCVFLVADRGKGNCPRDFFHALIHDHLDLYVYMHVYMYVSTNIWMRVYWHVRTYMYACMYVWMYVYVYMRVFPLYMCSRVCSWMQQMPTRFLSCNRPWLLDLFVCIYAKHFRILEWIWVSTCSLCMYACMYVCMMVCICDCMYMGVYASTNGECTPAFFK